MRKIELIIALLPSLCLDAKLALVHIIEEQDGAKQSGFAYTLCADKMHIAVKLNLCVWHMGTIDKYDFIKVSHLLRLRLC